MTEELPLLWQLWVLCMYFQCGLWSRAIISPQLFDNDEEATITVNGEVYRTIITDCFASALNGIDVNDDYFRQIGVTYRTPWPLRSCDLTQLDGFLWAADKPEPIGQLKVNFRNAIVEM